MLAVKKGVSGVMAGPPGTASPLAPSHRTAGREGSADPQPGPTIHVHYDPKTMRETDATEAMAIETMG